MNTFFLLKTKWWGAPFWVEDRGRYWVNYAGGLVPKHKDDKVLDTCEAEDLQKLDWTRTGMLKNYQTSCGWLSPGGEWYGCDSRDHSIVARWIIKAEEKELEAAGWIRVWNLDDWTCTQRGITEIQRSWLVHHGHKVNETEWGRL